MKATDGELAAKTQKLSFFASFASFAVNGLAELLTTKKRAATPFSAAAPCTTSERGRRQKEFRILAAAVFQGTHLRRTSLIGKIAVRRLFCKDFLLCACRLIILYRKLQGLTKEALDRLFGKLDKLLRTCKALIKLGISLSHFYRAKVFLRVTQAGFRADA